VPSRFAFGLEPVALHQPDPIATAEDELPLFVELPAASQAKFRPIVAACRVPHLEFVEWGSHASSFPAPARRRPPTASLDATGLLLCGQRGLFAVELSIALVRRSGAFGS